MTEPLFGLDTEPAKPETPERRRRQRQQQCLDHNQHPLTAALGTRLPLHPEPGRTCGNCVFRENVSAVSGKDYPKCTYRDYRGAPVHISRGPGTDVRAWWPGCHHHELNNQEDTDS